MSKKKDNPVQEVEDTQESEVSLSEKKDGIFDEELPPPLKGGVKTKAVKEVVSTPKGVGGSYKQLGGGVRVPASE